MSFLGLGQGCQALLLGDEVGVAIPDQLLLEFEFQQAVDKVEVLVVLVDHLEYLPLDGDRRRLEQPLEGRAHLCRVMPRVILFR